MLQICLKQQLPAPKCRKYHQNGAKSRKMKGPNSNIHLPMAILWPMWHVFPSFSRHLWCCSQEISGEVSYDTFRKCLAKLQELSWIVLKQWMDGCTQAYIHRMGCAVPFLHFLHLFCSGALSEGRLRELSSHTPERGVQDREKTWKLSGIEL